MSNVIDIRHKLAAHWRDEPGRLVNIAEQRWNNARTPSQVMWSELSSQQQQALINRLQTEQIVA